MLDPLPVPTRAYHGEGVVSYSQRHATRNHSDAVDIETGVRQRGILLPRFRTSPERLDVWRQLGGLHQSAFNTPDSIAGSVVSDRKLCMRCTQGNSAMGRQPRVGMVCVRHKRWLGAPQLDLPLYFPALMAERHFRKHLARQGVLFDSVAMNLGRECASPAFIGRSEIQRRKDRYGIDNIHALVYPQQVQFARLLARRTFLEFVTEPARQARDRRALIALEVAKILPPQDDSEHWRAMERIWDIVRRLTKLRREARLWGTPVHDADYNLLRFIEFQDLASDDESSDSIDDLVAGIAGPLKPDATTSDGKNDYGNDIIIRTRSA